MLKAVMDKIKYGIAFLLLGLGSNTTSWNTHFLNLKVSLLNFCGVLDRLIHLNKYRLYADER